MDLYLDLETFGEEPIKGGAHRYAEKSEVLLVALAWNDEPVVVWDTQDRPLWQGDLETMIAQADRVIIHNSAFDRTILRHHGVVIPTDKIVDTMVLALQHGLPGSLGQLCDILGVDQDAAKDKDGKKLIQLFTKPRPKNMKVRRATKETHPDEWQRFVEYARRDVDAMRHVYARTPRWNDTGSERSYWRIDQDTNDRGVAVDAELARSALRGFERASRTLSTLTAALTGGAVTATTQRDKLLAYLRETHDFVTDDMTKGTVSTILRDGALDPHVRELLEIRQQAAATSPAKYKALIGAVSADSRLRGTLQFCGAARTGRDAGRIFQPQNLPRTPDWFDGEVQAVTIRALKGDCEDLIWMNISERCSMSVRGCLVAAEDHTFAIADLSNIEGRVLAWGAGEEWKLEAFRAYDRGEGPDLYKVTAGRILGKDAADITKDERQSMGKVPELACLGPDTCVLTNNGSKAITEVTTDDLLWDGEEWVRHDGLIDRGDRETIWVAGLEVTPDHELLVGQTWLSAQTVASCQNTLDLALATGLVNLPWLAWTSVLWAAYERLSWRAHVARPITEWLSATCEREPAPAATVAPKSPQGAISSSTSGTPLSALTMRIADVYATVSRLASTAATTPTIARITTTADAASTSTNRGEPTEPHISRILSRLTDGIDLNSNLTELMSTGVTSRVISVSSDGAPTVTTCDVFETYKPASKSLRPVYDIANAGPRNRFTVLTKDGAFIAHNCGYQGSVGAFRVMGGPKVEAMDDGMIKEIVQGWRKAHPRTTAFWYDFERACKQAVRNPGDAFAVRDMVVFDVVPDQVGRQWLRMKLPSGRYLCYPDPEIGQEDCERCNGAGEFLFTHESTTRLMKCPHCGGSGKVGFEQLSYMGVNQYTRKWARLTTYGGKLCIAEGTPVLTRRGWVPIERVTDADTVWDGVEWVQHDGSTCNGVKEVIKAHGVWMTPDHEILTTEGWRCASQSEGFDRADARVPDGYKVRRKQRTKVAVAGAVRMRSGEADGGFGVSKATTQGRSRVLRLQAPREHSHPETDARNVGPQGVRGVAQSDSALYEPETSRLGQLRWAGRAGMRAVAHLVQRLLGGYGPNVSGGSYDRALGQQRGLRAEELRVGFVLAAGSEQAHQRDSADPVGAAHRSRRGGSGGAEPINSSLPRGKRLAGPHAAGSSGQRTTPVYDLVNAGPRHRFVVKGDDGCALIVHNCENWTQAVARDVFFSGMRRAVAAGYPVVLRVHDELVAEVRKDSGLTWEGLAEHMGVVPGWATGMPLAAAGFDADRYRKD